MSPLKVSRTGGYKTFFASNISEEFFGASDPSEARSRILSGVPNKLSSMFKKLVDTDFLLVN